MPTCNGSVRWKYTLGLLLKVGSTLVYTLPSSGRTITPAHNITLSVYPAYLLILCHTGVALNRIFIYQFDIHNNNLFVFI